MTNIPIRSPEQFLVFGAPIIEATEIEEVVASIKSGWLGTGPKVAQFEQDFAAYKEVENAIAVNSCSAALHLSLLALSLQPEDEVITTPLTFCATINAIIHVGATPVLVDVDPITMNIDPAQVEAKITPKTKAILPVHFAGRPCNMDALCQLASCYDLKIVEDCAHAIETEYRGKKAGTFGDFGCFSFYATKNICTGEGGMILARNSEDAARLKVLSLHGISKNAWKRFSEAGYKHYQVLESGFKYNMMDLQAALGIHQLKQVESRWLRRQEIWQHYNQAFADLPLTLPADPEPHTRHAYHLYTVLIDQTKTGIDRDTFLNAITAENIGVGVHYLSIPEHPYYQQKFGWQPEDYPQAMQIGRQTVSLPLSAKLTPQDELDAIQAVRKSLAINRPNQERRVSQAIRERELRAQLPTTEYQLSNLSKIPGLMKLVSVIILIYNSEQYIRAALESVLAQTYKNIEVLLIDDGSPDKSIEICRQFNDPRIRIISQQNRGLPGARNTGIRQAKGDYLAFIDGDDLWKQEKLEQHVNHLANSPEVGVSFSRSAFIDEAGTFLGTYQTPKLKGITPSYLLRCNPVGNGSAAVVRREVFTAIAFPDRQNDTLECYFDEQFRHSGGDVDCWLRVLLQTNWQIEGIPAALTLYRIHSQGLSAKLDRQLAAGEQLIAKIHTYSTPPDANWEAVTRAYHLRYLARSAIRWKSDAIAIQLMHQAISTYRRIILESPRQTVMTLIAAYLLLLVPRRLHAQFELLAGKTTTIFQKLRTG